jgi:hypothetical protein
VILVASRPPSASELKLMLWEVGLAEASCKSTSKTVGGILDLGGAKVTQKVMKYTVEFG